MKHRMGCVNDMFRMESIRRNLVKLISVLFSAYWIFTFLSVLCLERDAVAWKRDYDQSNLLPMLAALVILAVIDRLAGCGVCRRIEQISERRFYLLLAAASAAVLAVQMICLPQIAKPLASDFQIVRETAGSIGLHHTMVYEAYFNRCPNNQPITFLFAMMMRLFGKWSIVIATGVLLINLSVLLTAQMAYRMTGSIGVGLMVFAIGVLLYDFSYRAFVPYTDNYCVFFMVLPLAILLNGKRGIGWICLAAGSMALACFIKITAAIPLIAGAVVLLLIRMHDWKRTLMRAVLFVTVLLCTFGGLVTCKDICFRDVGFVKKTVGGLGAWHYFMTGQNDRTIGAVASEDVRYSMRFKTQEERDAANRAEGVRRIRERGIVGNLVFFTDKNFQNYDDGGFSIVQKLSEGEAFEDSFITSIFVKEGANFRFYTFMLQTLWLLTLTLILYEAVRGEKENGRSVFLKLVILGVSLYALLFESRAKYLYMFVPFYLLLASEGLRLLLARARAPKQDAKN